eukprot:TRINITY_DN1879_c0_g1_i4.p1 TRINITY_DN1879_c0_g1~~TRINITY_DN1879_c0_g1_i4.p1  ORF type:complete len:1008 (+),score=287.87 TRINITY_DN1879_c0_g1_i4:193-3216(+)
MKLCALMLLLVGALSTVLSKNSYVYLGCFNNIQNLTRWNTSDIMSPFWCINHCESNKMGFMALRSNSSCYCSNAPRQAQLTDERSCNAPCLGDRNQMCGGARSYSLYANSLMPGVRPSARDEAVWDTLVVNDSSTTFTISPGRRGGHSAILTERGGMFIFGGYTLWSLSMYNISANTTQSGDESLNITNTEEQISYVYSYSGPNNITHFNNVWRFDTNTHSWFRHHNGIGIAPTARSSHTAVWTSRGGDRGTMVVYGGFTGPGDDPRPMSDVWAYNISAKEWSQWPSINAPNARGGHTAILHSSNTSMIVFGGSSATNYLHDVWSYDFMHGDWRLLHDGSGRNVPPPRSRHAAVRAPDGNMIVTFGRGHAPNCISDFQDTWKFDLATHRWRLLSDGTTPWDRANHRWATPVPPVRYGHAALIISNRTMLVLGGGRNSVIHFDVWAFDLETFAWVQVDQPLVRPSTRSGFSMIAVSDGIIIFGGEYNSDLYFNDVWHLRMLEHAQLTMAISDDRSTEWAVGLALGVYWLMLLTVFAVAAYRRRDRPPRAAKVSRLPWKRAPEEDVPLVTLDEAPLKSDQAHLLEEVEIVMELHQPRMHIFHQHSHFDQLADKVLLQIFGYLHGQEVARVSQVSRRFHRVVQKQSYWKDMVLQEWAWRYAAASIISVLSEQDLLRAADYTVDYFGVYVRHNGRLRKRSFAGFLYSVLLFMRTSPPLYALLFLCTLQTYLVGLKIDDFIALPWHAVLFPAWIVNAVLVCMGVLLSYFVFRQSQTPFDWPVRKLYPFLRNPSGTVPVAVSVALLILSTLFLALKLDYTSPFSAQHSWWFVGFPVYLLLAILTVHHVVGALLGDVSWSWGSFWMGFTCCGYLVTWLLVIAKIESDHFSNTIEWWTVFIPWWVSDAFALAAVMFVCSSFAATKLIWTALATYLGYLLCIATFQGLLNSNLVTPCGDNPVAFSYTLIFIPLYILFSVIGVIGVAMMSQRAWITRIDKAYTKLVYRFAGGEEERR